VRKKLAQSLKQLKDFVGNNANFESFQRQLLLYLAAQQLADVNKMYVAYSFFSGSALDCSSNLLFNDNGEINKKMNFKCYWRAIKRMYQSKFSSSEKNNQLRELKMGALFYDYTHTFSNFGREVGISDTLKCDWYREGLRSWLRTKLEAYQETDFDRLVEHTKLIDDRNVLNNRNKTIINSKVQQETSTKKQ
jgi:hypothetical protein